MKCFEEIVTDFLTSSLPLTLDLLQFIYRTKISTDDGINHFTHTVRGFLDTGRGNYVKMLFVNYSSAVNTIIPPDFS